MSVDVFDVLFRSLDRISFGKGEELHHVNAFKLVLKVQAEVQVLLVEQHVWMSMLRDLFFELGHEIVMFVEELGILLYFALCF